MRISDLIYVLVLSAIFAVVGTGGFFLYRLQSRLVAARQSLEAPVQLLGGMPLFFLFYFVCLILGAVIMACGIGHFWRWLFYFIFLTLLVTAALATTFLTALLHMADVIVAQRSALSAATPETRGRMAWYLRKWAWVLRPSLKRRGVSMDEILTELSAPPVQRSQGLIPPATFFL